MNIVDFSVKRYVAILCLVIALVGLGINSYRKLPVEELPQTDLPYVTVIAVYPGAAPGEIETDVAKPIEDAVSSLDALKNITSTCAENLCLVLLEFEVGTDVDIVANDVREKLNLIINNFPTGVENPHVLKYDINALPIMNLAITGDLPEDELYEYADTDFRDRLAAVRGVAEVRLTGGSKLETQVLLDRNKLAARGLHSLNVVESIQKEVKLIPAGHITDNGREFSVKFDADFSNPAELENLEIANKDGQRCRLKDVGRVILTSAEKRQAAYLNGKPCIAAQIVKKAEGNAVELVKEIKARIAEMKKNLPGGIEIELVSDNGEYISSTVDNATGSVWQGILLTAILMFFFLYNLRSTFIVALTMPVTVLIGIFLLYLSGYSLNTSTLLALGLSIGILITNSIVVLENIIDKINKGMPIKEAATTGSKEILVAVIASAGTNLVVLLPILQMKGVLGQFIIPFSVTTIAITIVSLFISFTMTPALASLIMKPSTERPKFLISMENIWNKIFSKFTAFVLKINKAIVSSKVLTIAVILISVLLFLHSLTLVPSIGFTFLPISDRGEITVKMEFPSDYALETTISRIKDIMPLIQTIPELKKALFTIGKIDGGLGQNSEGVYLAQAICKYSEKYERKKTIFTLRDELVEMLKAIPDMSVTTSLPDPSGSGANMRLLIKGDDLNELDRIGNRLLADAANFEWLQDIETSVMPPKNELVVKPKRAILSDLKVPSAALGLTLRTNIEGTVAGTMKTGDRSRDIRVKLEKAEGTEQISGMQLPSPVGQPIILSNFAEVKQESAPVLISRHNKQRMINFMANPAQGTPLGTAAQRLLDHIEKENLLPPGYSTEYAGKVEILDEAILDFAEVGIMAFVLTYLVLASVLNSFTRPLIILITIPLGLAGSLWTLHFAGETMSVLVLLGGVMMIGIVVNMAILIMDRVQVNRDAGMKPHEAMFEALEHEMRAVAMITLAAVTGMLPFALDTTLGSEFRTAIGLASAGGIFFSGLLTLFLLPAIYLFFTKNEKEGK
ncbi:MAG: efflux RND transporter permease subunit [Candidatus Riflebacteria bacterium]|nr:efflux RND transporter permease subunit [Candidatus Riflebacteria bacterium]